MGQLGLFIAGATAATAVNAAICSYMYHQSYQNGYNVPDEEKKFGWKDVKAGTGIALGLDAGIIAPVLTGAAALEALRSRPGARAAY